MSCGEPSLHPEIDLYSSENQTTMYEELKLFLKAIDITPRDYFIKNGVIDRLELGRYSDRVYRNYKTFLNLWENRDDHV
tara:strand:+ start:2141 stop:2377 length:237 start_codon:yes stop_codon:yes gene_type:complete